MELVKHIGLFPAQNRYRKQAMAWLLHLNGSMLDNLLVFGSDLGDGVLTVFWKTAKQMALMSYAKNGRTFKSMAMQQYGDTDLMLQLKMLFKCHTILFNSKKVYL